MDLYCVQCGTHHVENSAATALTACSVCGGRVFSSQPSLLGSGIPSDAPYPTSPQTFTAGGSR